MAGGNNDRVQLKQEEVVGNDVVLSDINPKTNTRSVDDPTTGLSLDKTIERMWQAINNKLSRIVNSVNGRTGVVVLSPEDVGLGNVDNVSLADIKQWVINKMIVEFGHKRLILFDFLDEVTEYISDNDEAHRDKPFYSHHGFGTDKRAYIGYTWWDEGTQTLNETHMAIDTVGWTDNSIIYNESLPGKKSFAGGGLGVNIYMYEDALELYNGLTKTGSGLRIKKDKLVPVLYRFEGVYGDGTPEDESAFLYFKTPPTTDTPEISIYIDDNFITNAFIRMNTNDNKDHKFKIGDLIICDFKDYRVWTPDESTETDPNPKTGKYVVPTGMNFDLMYRGACVGCITSAPTLFEPDKPYIANFYTIGGHVGYSINEVKDDKYGGSQKTPRDHYEVKLAIGKYPMNNINEQYRQALTPIDAIGDTSIPNSEVRESLLRINFPYGRDEIKFNSNNKTDESGGLILNTDMSLCIQPFDMCTSDATPDNSASETAYNWAGVFGKKVEGSAGERDSVLNKNTLISESITDSDYHAETAASYLGINLIKTTELHNPDMPPNTVNNRYIFTNVSGLRVNHSGDTLTPEFLGMSADETTGETSGPEFGTLTSGGLSVNVGNFLEIKPGDIPVDCNEFYDGGKVNVRIGNGLGDDGNNRIAVKLTGNAAAFDSDGNVNVNVAFYKTGIEYNPGSILYIPSTASVNGVQTDVTIVASVKKNFIASTLDADLDNITKICQIVGKVIEP